MTEFWMPTLRSARVLKVDEPSFFVTVCLETPPGGGEYEPVAAQLFPYDPASERGQEDAYTSAEAAGVVWELGEEDEEGANHA